MIEPKDFILIGTDQPFYGEVPEPLELPIHKNEPVPHAELQIVSKGDKGYEEALIRWMFLGGYALPEVNDMEMKKRVIVVKGGPTSGNYGHAGRPGKVGGSTSERLAEIKTYAGYKAHAKNPYTGDYNVLYDAEKAGMDTYSGKWADVCEKHGTIVSFDKYTNARAHLPDADWCEECMEIRENDTRG